MLSFWLFLVNCYSILYTIYIIIITHSWKTITNAIQFILVFLKRVFSLRVLIINQIRLMDLRNKVVSAPLIWLEGRFQKDVYVRVNEKGIIEQIGSKSILLPGEDAIIVPNSVILIEIIKCMLRFFPLKKLILIHILKMIFLLLSKDPNLITSWIIIGKNFAQNNTICVIFVL